MIGENMVELRGLEQYKVGDETVCNAVVRTEYSDKYEKRELFKNEPVNRGQVLKALSRIYGVPAGQIVWPRHIRI